MRFYLGDNGGSMTVSSDSVLSPAVPDGYREVTVEEYNAAVGLVILNDPRASVPAEPAAPRRSRRG